MAGLLAAAFLKAHRIVVEVNVPGNIAYGVVLNNVENLRRALAPEGCEVEVVCHGAGLDLLLAKGRMAAREAKLAKAGVRFVACANTMRGRGLARSDLPGFAGVVPSGVAEVVRRQEAGWSYLKGGY